MVRNFAHQVEIKILFSEIYRAGDLTDAEWTAKYEKLKDACNIEEISQYIDRIMENGYSLDHAMAIVRETMRKSKRKVEIESL